MALRKLMLKRALELKNQELEELRAKRSELEEREAELEKAINEAVTEEERSAVQAEVEQFEADVETQTQAETDLDAEIRDLESQLSEEEEKKPAEPAAAPAPAIPADERSKKSMGLNIRALPKTQRAFDALTAEQQRSIVERDDVKSFLSQLRGMKGQTRAVSGGELLIPVDFLDIISENVFRYSKLLNRVRVRNVSGQARQTISGTVPEAIWTEMCGAINELTFLFNQVTVDGYKVAGFIPVCNALLEDNDIDLAAEIIEMLSEALGLAKDKAILYGKGSSNKMPLGIVTRLAQTSQPADYPASAPAWVDLHTSNIKTISSDLTGAAFWSALTLAAGNAFSVYARGTKFWAMNSKTYNTLKSKVITFTASGDLAANVFGYLPIIDGDIDILEFIPDGDIIGGYGDLYLYAQRSGIQIDVSTEVNFLQDETVFRGKERADGLPVIPAAFVAINISGSSVTTTMTFAADKANDAKLAALAVGSETLSPSFGADVLTYAVTAANASDKIEATPAQPGALVEIVYNNKQVRNGGTVTWLADSTAHALTITVTQGNAVRVYTVNVTKSA